MQACLTACSCMWMSYYPFIQSEADQFSKTRIAQTNDYQTFYVLNELVRVPILSASPIGWALQLVGLLKWSLTQLGRADLIGPSI